jgi:hypothetical protein
MTQSNTAPPGIFLSNIKEKLGNRHDRSRNRPHRSRAPAPEPCPDLRFRPCCFGPRGHPPRRRPVTGGDGTDGPRHRRPPPLLLNRPVLNRPAVLSGWPVRPTEADVHADPSERCATTSRRYRRQEIDFQRRTQRRVVGRSVVRRLSVACQRCGDSGFVVADISQSHIRV